MKKIGVIGAGLLGTACLRRMIGAGIEVVAYDVDAAKREAARRSGCSRSRSPAPAARWRKARGSDWSGAIAR